MRGYLLLTILLVTGLSRALDYPPAPRGDVVDDYFGIEVPDPYRWLENTDSPETVLWVEAQKILWQSYLDSIPVRGSIRSRLEELYDYRRLSMPYRKGDSYFFYMNDGLQEHSVFYTADSIGGEPTVLVDPNGFGDPRLSFQGSTITDDGTLMAWYTSHSGSDWRTVHFMDLETGAALEDTLTWLKGGVSWDGRNTGVYYSMYDPPREGMEYTQENRNQRILYHRLGTGQEEDSLVYRRPDMPDWMLGAGLTEDGNYLVIYVYDTNIAACNGLFYIDLVSSERQVVELLDRFDASYSMIGNTGGTFYFMTDLDAPRGRIIAIDVSSPDREDWVEVVPETDRILTSASILNGDRTLAALYSWEGYDSVILYDMEGNPEGEPSLPGKGAVWGFRGNQADTETFYTYTSFLHPGEVYAFDLVSGESRLLWKPEIDADLSLYREEQVFYRSFDGTMVPMFLVYPEDVVPDGSNPVLLNGYGGFGVSMGPWFSTSLIPWLEMGGIYAVPCIRGGGEYGEEWHLAGIRENRPVVFGDFIAAAEYLIDSGYTSTSRLAVSGGSNGGTLVAAVVNMRPDLFGAAAPAMGVMDLMRFHLFTIGWAWVAEYGDPEDRDDVEFLFGYSPYHNIREGIEYPPMMISTADHDDRVVPGHSFKYGARVQAAQAGEAPILMSITPSAGHGGSVGLSESLDRKADLYAFLWKELKM